MSAYTRSNAIPNQQIELRTLFKKFNAPFDPADWGPVLITKKDPRDPTYVEATDLLETIPKVQISHVGAGLFQYQTANTTITAVGTFYDVFKFKFEIGGDEFMVVNTFQVTANGLPKLGYVTTDEVYGEGLDQVKYPPALVNSRIAVASRMIDEFTGRWFEARQMTMDIDGTGTYELHLDTPIVSVDEVVLLDREFPVTKVFTFELDDLVIYNRHIAQGMVEPDDRENPMLGNVYFPKGRMNIRLTGAFGYTDGNGNTPDLIKRACILMVLRDKEPLASRGRQNSLLVGLGGPLKSERTDDHEYELAVSEVSMGSRAYFTGDPEIDQLLLNFRRPPKLGRNLGANVSSVIDGGADHARFRSGFDFFFGRSV